MRDKKVSPALASGVIQPVIPPNAGRMVTLLTSLFARLAQYFADVCGELGDVEGFLYEAR